MTNHTLHFPRRESEIGGVTKTNFDEIKITPEVIEAEVSYLPLSVN